MPNYRRPFVAGGTFFFTVVTHERQPILTSKIARDCLRKTLQLERSKRPFTIDALVLLPDHLHSIWTLPSNDSDFSVRWNRIKASFTQEYMSSQGAEGYLSQSRLKRGERGVWQRRFYVHSVRNPRDLKPCIDCVHINPLKHGLVDKVQDWKWSSFHRYVKLGEYSIDWGSSTGF